MNETIEVFQDLHVDVPSESLAAFRVDLIAAATGRWSIDLVRSRELMDVSAMASDVILFRREESDGCPAAGLTFWANETGYYVPNIVPLEVGQLTHAQYNTVLSHFVSEVLAAVATRHGAVVRTGKTHETPADWWGDDAALKLRRFSGAANKSTGASHPSDQRRWFDFILAAHRQGGRMDGDRLARWLRTADGWDEDTAHDLAADFESALSLLAYYDEN